MKEKLVSYRNLKYAIKREGLCNAIPIPEKRFNALRETLPYESFDNDYMPRMYLQITGRCNMRCKHCFSAVDNHPLVTEFPLEEMRDLFRQAREIGMYSVTLTGGEPTVYPYLMEALQSIRENELTLMDFNTNGYVLKDELLDEIQALGFRPNIKISLDGIGTHDDFRGVIGSEERALEAMRRCLERGFRTYAQTQVNRKTLAALPLLLDRVEDLGLTSVRLIKTVATPRWQENGPNDNLTFYEYYEEMLRLIEYQHQKNNKTNLDIWQMAYVDFSGLGTYRLSAEKVRRACQGEALCPAYTEMLSVGSDGKIYPCLEMQGVVNFFGYSYGSLKENSLKELVNQGKYRDMQSFTVVDRQRHHQECMACAYQTVCHGGCPGLAMIYSGGDYLGIDRSCCEFFKTGIYERTKALLEHIQSSRASY